MSRQDLEHKLQCSVVQHLRLMAAPGIYWAAIPNGGSRSARTGAKLKAEGVRAGAPDLLIVVDGKAHGLELKVGKNRQTDTQKATEAEWTAAGGVYVVAHGINEALNYLRQWGVLRRDLNAPRLEAAE